MHQCDIIAQPYVVMIYAALHTGICATAVMRGCLPFSEACLCRQTTTAMLDNTHIIQAADAECHFNDNGAAEITPADILYISRLHYLVHYCVCASLRHRCGCQIDFVSRAYVTGTSDSLRSTPTLASATVCLPFIISNVLRVLLCPLT